MYCRGQYINLINSYTVLGSHKLSNNYSLKYIQKIGELEQFPAVFIKADKVSTFWIKLA